MSADFNWWLVLVGVVIGAALTWLVVSESQRREREIADRELEAEAGWIARTVDAPGLDAEHAELVLRAHRRYLGFPPPDTLVDPSALQELARDSADGTAASPASPVAPATTVSPVGPPAAPGPTTPEPRP